MEKIYVPKNVAKYIDYCKIFELTLLEAILGSRNDTRNFRGSLEEVIRYARDNQETFAMAWVIGYKVFEPKYKVKIKAITGSTKYLLYGEVSDTWYFGIGESINLRVLHTEKDLEEAGFGWVFHCKGVEIEEVNNG